MLAEAGQVASDYTGLEAVASYLPLELEEEACYHVDNSIEHGDDVAVIDDVAVVVAAVAAVAARKVHQQGDDVGEEAFDAQGWTNMVNKGSKAVEALIAPALHPYSFAAGYRHLLLLLLRCCCCYYCC